MSTKVYTIFLKILGVNYLSDWYNGFSAIASPITGLIGLGVQGGIQSKNLELQKAALDWQKSVDERNFNYQQGIDQRNFDYMAATQQTEWNRQDTAHQREVDDLMRAGLSPLASTVGSQSGSVVSQNSAPSMSGVSPVVPQIDGSAISNGFASLVSSLDAKSEREMRERVSAADRLSTEHIAMKNLDKQFEMFKAELAQRDKEFSGDMAQRMTEFVSNFQFQKSNLDEIIRSNKASELNAKQSNLLREHESIASAVESITGSKSYYVFRGSNDEALEAQRKWAVDYETAAVDEFKKLVVKARSYAGSVNVGNGSGSSGSEGAGSGDSGAFSNFMNSVSKFTNINVGASGSYSSMDNAVEEFNEWKRNYCAKNPYPWNGNIMND